MADLVTHACLGALIALPFGRGRVAMAAMGAVLPDLVSRVPSLALELVGLAPEWVLDLAFVGHVPLGTVLWCGLFAQAFAERGRAFAWLGVGALTHYGLDLLQDHHGVGYQLAVPLSGVRFELGWIGSEATVGLAPWLLALTLLLLALAARRGDEDRRGPTN